jgi:hypothetical protein
MKGTWSRSPSRALHAFAEHVLTHAAALWSNASLDDRRLSASNLLEWSLLDSGWIWNRRNHRGFQLPTADFG